MGDTRRARDGRERATTPGAYDTGESDRWQLRRGAHIEPSGDPRTHRIGRGRKMRQKRLRMTIALVGLGQLALGCDDATTFGRSGPRAARASRDQAHVKMPQELWVTSQG